MDSGRDPPRVANFMSSLEDDVELSKTRMLSVLEGKDLARVVEENVFSESIEDYTTKFCKASALIFTSLGDAPLKAVQSVANPTQMWKKMKKQQATRTTASKIGELTTLIHYRYTPGSDKGQYFSDLENLFNRLNAMGAPVDETMLVATLLVSLMRDNELQGTVVAIKTVDED